ncbi:DUF6629 family protein [Streptomyces sp. NPDC059650]|uniref:DUF6629 family protein n=1 Tax=Streptomyces sp. NPDC059650 TaxID=3346896 RepID=UPI0036A227A4
MRWSATADLTAGTAIAAVAVVCLARVRRARDLPVAALPLLLGAHQRVEAAVWRAGGGPGAATTAWAVVAMPLLAVWVPFGVLLSATPAAPRRLSGRRRPGSPPPQWSRTASRATRRRPRSTVTPLRTA